MLRQWAVKAPPVMWRPFRNLWFNLQTYTDLSPDLGIRQQVNQLLRQRPTLTLDEWFEEFWRPQNVSKQIAAFVYTRLEQYSGLVVARMWPSDRLEEDLHLALVCWFDWQMTLCDDFLKCFGVDISNGIELFSLTTLEELVLFLNQQLIPVECSPS